VTAMATPPAVAVAGWTLQLIDTGAIRAPSTWIDPHGDENELVWLPSGALLCRRPGEVMLVDCGVGPFGDGLSFEVRHVDVADALRSAGAGPDEVTTLVLTHLDTDHAGGAVTRDETGIFRPAYAGATVRVLEPAVRLLDGPDNDLAARLGRTLEISSCRDGGQVASGARLRSAPGHRTGHATLELETGGERFVHLADVIHAREHVAHPEWDFLHDSEPDVALATRRSMLDELAGTGTVVACSHVDTFGRIERTEGDGLVWVDLD